MIVRIKELEKTVTTKNDNEIGKPEETKGVTTEIENFT